MPHKTAIILLTLLFGMLLLISCRTHDQFPDLAQYIAFDKKKFITEVEQKPTHLQPFPPPVRFKASDLRSPFSEQKELMQRNLSLNPLENYPITMLRFSGTVKQNNQYFAFILTPDNILHQVGLDDKIGNRGGKIVMITAERIEIKEPHSGEDSKATSQTMTLQLKD